LSSRQRRSSVGSGRVAGNRRRSQASPAGDWPPQSLTLTRYGNGIVVSGDLHVNLEYERAIKFSGLLHVSGQAATRTGTPYVALAFASVAGSIRGRE